MKNKITFTNLVGKQFCMLSDEPNKFMIDSIEKNAISKIEFDKTYNLLSEEAACLFSNYSKLTDVNIDKLNTSNVTDMSFMFCECLLLKSLNISNFNTSAVINMEWMFGSCYKLDLLDLSNFDTSNAISMHSMFSECYHLKSLDLSNFNTDKVTNMKLMFYQCSSLPILDISSFDFSNVKNITNMFTGCTSLVDLKFGKNLKVSINLSDCPLSHESALSVIDGLAEVKEQEIIRFSEETYAALSAKEKQIIKNKNWLYIPFIN